MSHLAAVKRILRYVKGYIGCRILFPAMDMGIKYNLLDFIDSNRSGNKVDRTFKVIYNFMFDETLISWFSKRELVIALSSCEAEYITASLCACEVV